MGEHLETDKHYFKFLNLIFRSLKLKENIQVI